MFFRYFADDIGVVSLEPRYRSMSGTRMNNTSDNLFGMINDKTTSHRYRSPGAIVDTTKKNLNGTIDVRHEPRLAIIDFNQLTRGGIDIATSKNRAKIPKKSSDCFGKLKR